MLLKPAQKDDLSAVIELLKFWELPFIDVGEPAVHLYLLKEKDRLNGTGGLEIYGDDALIRSVAVAEEFRGTGLGKTICGELEQIAAESGVKTLYLLTTTATHFFERRGYRIVKREEFPDRIKETGQFSELCPVSAVCMIKTL
ncbi:MAG: hypothetical protein A2W90_02275 [Bacteroidetes bacterium GWF2_42_66]|nr:MAG: hypothetical protein A2W92_17065 [Bacteroidetes bacterium GWA2_42_15]OFY01177.1 MAG: hypothetical protein A2W89_15760 [Bacteroidetes bacterium GWE2_42_39]OFY42020.1 MAG: hypothetical protein A2W90_02275 [Bacteroidetes bacterium GWF2_42_66]HBL77779.1 GNAT family N-acetyltransferase [Prolixibacteraceae bacterium]HCR89493.1 GNAT family N-acetyltransferase [Prolixibacteraceae bacterium]